MTHITLIPTGGLCNRLRAIASTYQTAKRSNCALRVVWNRYDGMNARFSDLFKPIENDNITLEDNNAWIYRINRRQDYYVRQPLLKLKYDSIYFQPSSFNDSYLELTEKMKACKDNNLLSISGSPLCKDYPLAGMFIPADDIAERIQETTSKFSSNTIGIHIRRTDCVESIDKSPTQAFMKKIDEEIAHDENSVFYLASDDNKVKEQLKSAYGNRIITTIDNTQRDNIEGIKFAVYDLFCLSHTSKIIGSYYSSYTQEAARLGNIQLEYAKKQQE